MEDFVEFLLFELYILSLFAILYTDAFSYHSDRNRI